MTEPRRRPRLLAGLALGVAFALSAAGGADPAAVDVAMAKARSAVARGDGIAAEVALEQAMAAGASRKAVAALMGEAWLDQDDQAKAREWLGPGDFAPADAPHGFRALARLEMLAGNLPAAGRALDRAVALEPANADIWVEIAHLRYRGGEQVQAVEALDRAHKIDTGNGRALLFHGLIVRDQYGYDAALPWFEAGLLKDRANPELLAAYAATLGEAGHARQMLTITRHMIDSGADPAQAMLFQAVLAARAGDDPLARSMLNRVSGPLLDSPASNLVSGVLELRAGNGNAAVQALARLVTQQPHNARAQSLYARALYVAGDLQQVVERFTGLADRPDASSFLLTVVGRALEDLGRRAEAAPYLDRAAQVHDPMLSVVPEWQPVAAAAQRYHASPRDADAAIAYVRGLLAVNNAAEAAKVANGLSTTFPGLGAAQALVGDVEYAQGQFGAAAQSYGRASAVRFDDALLARLVMALARSGARDAAAEVTARYLASHPQSRMAIRLAADHAASVGDWRRAQTLLQHLQETGGGRDVRLLADLAYARLRGGDAAGAEQAAHDAYRLQPASRIAAQIWAMALAARNAEPELIRQLQARLRS